MWGENSCPNEFYCDLPNKGRQLKGRPSLHEDEKRVMREHEPVILLSLCQRRQCHEPGGSGCHCHPGNSLLSDPVLPKHLSISNIC